MFVLASAILGLFSYVRLYGRSGQPIHSDGFSYYVYVPSVLLYHDTTLDAFANDWYGGIYPQFTGIVRQPNTGRFLNPHPIGTAILMAPFVVGAHLLTRWSNFPPDGFSYFYQHGAALAGLFYMLAGLAVLGRTLSRHFSTPVVLATLAITTWGTNLFHYGVYDGTFSHVFAFFLIAILIELTELWWARATVLRSIGLGVVAALLFLTRHTDVVFLAIVPLYQGRIGRIGGMGGTGRSGEAAGSGRTGRSGGIGLWNRRGHFALVAAIGLIGIAPQLVLYKRATGAWLTSPYASVGAGFHFADPQFFGVLLSTQKGLFFWSPVLLLAVAGVFVARGAVRQFAAGAVVTMLVNTFLIASWSDWQFGSSFGHRAFTDSLALLALFIASTLAWATERPRLALAVYAFAALAVGLSAVQTVQYWNGILPQFDTTWAQYRAVFLQLR